MLRALWVGTLSNPGTRYGAMVNATGSNNNDHYNSIAHKHMYSVYRDRVQTD